MALGCHVLPSGRATLVAMVQSADLRDSDDSPSLRGWIGRGSGLSFSSARCVRLRRLYSMKLPRCWYRHPSLRHDHLIEALASDSSDHPFDIARCH